MDERLQQLDGWLRSTLRGAHFELAPASSDASFRRYFRVRVGEHSYIVMDAPPVRENCRPFVRIAGALAEAGLNVPRVLEADFELGFLLLTDLGVQQYLGALSDASADRLYGDAMTALLRLQCFDTPHVTLPDYDEALLRRELGIFPEWFLSRHIGLSDSDEITTVLDATSQVLVRSALEQPRVWVHRDFHSRNLMVTACDNPGVLDFQDAVRGPVTYDLVSLLRDCYIRWPIERVDRWRESHLQRLRALGRLPEVAASDFQRWFDLMGAQRHLKAIGIFARLYHRDQKPGYLGDIPRTLSYVREVSGHYAELGGLRWLIDEKILPVFSAYGS